MRIGELSAATGVDVETIRYYEKRGLLPAPTRADNGYRAYRPEHVERLAFIRHCRALDMSLVDVRRLLDLLAHPEAACHDVDCLLDAHLERVHERVRGLQSLARQLTALRERCRARSHTGTCGILQELVAAAQGEGCVCHGADPEPSPGGQPERETW